MPDIQSTVQRHTKLKGKPVQDWESDPFYAPSKNGKSRIVNVRPASETDAVRSAFLDGLKAAREGHHVIVERRTESLQQTIARVLADRHSLDTWAEDRVSMRDIIDLLAVWKRREKLKAHRFRKELKAVITALTAIVGAEAVPKQEVK